METMTLPQPPAATPGHTWRGGHCLLLDALAGRLAGQTVPDSASLAAVTILTMAAAPDRAERLRPGPGDSVALVERLAAWALRRVDAPTVEHALTALHEIDIQGVV